MQTGTGKRYGAQSERGELSVWGGIVSARLKDFAGALDADPEAILSAAQAEGIEPVVDTAEPKGRGNDRDRPTEPGLRCLAFNRQDFQQLVAAVAPGEEVKTGAETTRPA